MATISFSQHGSRRPVSAITAKPSMPPALPYHRCARHWHDHHNFRSIAAAEVTTSWPAVMPSRSLMSLPPALSQCLHPYKHSTRACINHGTTPAFHDHFVPAARLAKHHCAAMAPARKRAKKGWGNAVPQKTLYTRFTQGAAGSTVDPPAERAPPQPAAATEEAPPVATPEVLGEPLTATEAVPSAQPAASPTGMD